MQLQPPDIDQVARWLMQADMAVAFTGAGISTESGIPDFRSPGGVWSRNRTVYFDEYLQSADARIEYWRQKAEAHRDFHHARPNAAHETLAAWEAAGLLHGVITQNIDGLHQLAGSARVLELHGTARFVACLECERRYDAEDMVKRFHATQAIPSCEVCGGITKHATVSFGQALPEKVLREAAEWARQADVFLAMGSSLVVEPAASLPRMARENGAHLVIINRDATPLDTQADVVIRAALGEAMTALRLAVSSQQST